MNNFDAWIIRSLGVFVPICTGIGLGVLIELKTEVAHLNDIKANKVNTMTFRSYIATETGRSEVVAELLGAMYMRFDPKLREEDLELFRQSTIRKLDRSIKIATTRGK